MAASPPAPWSAARGFRSDALIRAWCAMAVVVAVGVWALAGLVLAHVSDRAWVVAGVLAAAAGLCAAWRGRRLVALFVGAGVALACAVGWLSVLWPRHDRNWEISISRLPAITIEGDRCTIDNLRAFRWRSLEDFDTVWDRRTYDLGTLESVEFFVEPFQDSELMAHTMLGFGFADGRRLIVTIEARKEEGEAFGLIAGALRQFELIYVFADERDALTQRAVGRGARIFAYPVRATAEQRRALFEDLARSANEIRERPRFYHAIRSNCTTTLVGHADRLREHKIGLRPKTLFPALAGELLVELGMLDSDLPYAEARERFRIDGLAREHAEDPEFSRLIRPWLSPPD